MFKGVFPILQRNPSKEIRRNVTELKTTGPIESLEGRQDSLPHRDSRLQLGFVLKSGPSNIT